MNKLPEKYVVKTDTAEQTREVANLLKEDCYSWSYCPYIYWDKSDIYGVL